MLISVIVVVCIVIMKKKGYGGKVFGRFGGNRSVGVVNHHPPTTTVTTTPGNQGNAPTICAGALMAHED